MKFHISKINQLRNKAKDDLNTLVGINQMQYLRGFEFAIENVYLESNRSRDIDGFVSQEICDKLLIFISENVNILANHQSSNSINGQIAAYTLCKEEIEKSLAQVLK